MGSNFNVKIDPYVLEKIDSIDYYNQIMFKKIDIGISLTSELVKAKEIIEMNPYIGKKIDINKFKYVMSSVKSVLYYEVIENKKVIAFYDLKPFKQNKNYL